jgi:pleiotropic regulator 1
VIPTKIKSNETKTKKSTSTSKPSSTSVQIEDEIESTNSNTIEQLIDTLPIEKKTNNAFSTALVTRQSGTSNAILPYQLTSRQQLILKNREITDIKPDWHAPWKLMRVIAGHQGWVRTVAVDVSNEWFATGSNDRTIKVNIKIICIFYFV